MRKLSLPLSYHLSQSKQTEQLGAQLAAHCPLQCVLFLEGVLGAGKTTFSKGFIRWLSDTPHIKSPTYTLLESYTTSSARILHFDLYRVNNPFELEEIGIRDYMQQSAIWLIEWPKKAMMENGFSLLPQADLVLNFLFLSDSHQVTLTPRTQIGDQLVKALMIEE